MTSVLSRSAALTARTRPLTGDTKMSFVNDDHMGWMRCDGRSLDTTAYNLLFQVIGYTFGGSGSNFLLPDARGRVIGNAGTIVDACDPSGVAFGPGASLGEVNHQLTIAEMPAHNHNSATGSPGNNTTAVGNTSDATTGITHNGTGPTGGGRDGYGLAYQDGHSTQSASVNDGAEPNLFTSIAALTLTDPGHHHTIASNGGNACHNNMQPTLFYSNTFIYCGVPMNGIFPFSTGRNPVLI